MVCFTLFDQLVDVDVDLNDFLLLHFHDGSCSVEDDLFKVLIGKLVVGCLTSMLDDDLVKLELKSLSFNYFLFD